MLDSTRTARSCAIIGLLLVALTGANASAQIPVAPAPITPEPQHVPAFLTRSDFSFLGGWIVSSDPQFSYDAKLTADFDAVDYGVGRTNVLVSYEMGVGSERRHFDVNHGNYEIELSSSYRAGPIEVSAFYHHESRHLADRENPSAVSWNVIGARASKRVVVRDVIVEASGSIGRVMQPAFVDYTWIGDAHLRVRQPLTKTMSLFASGAGALFGVDPAKNGRGRQTSGRAEAGLHLEGKKGALEAFAGYERRADAFPTDLVAVKFFTFGIRLMTR